MLTSYHLYMLLTIHFKKFENIICSKICIAELIALIATILKKKIRKLLNFDTLIIPLAPLQC